MAKRRRDPSNPAKAGDASSLADAKRRVSMAMLGRDGVHAVGIRQAEGAVAVYVAGSDAASRATLRQRALPLAAPHAVVVVESEEARGA